MYHGNRLWVLLQARGVLCELRVECQVDFTDFKAHSPIPDRKQQYKQRTFLGFLIFRFRRNLIIQNDNHFPLQIYPQLSP
jgi:hypothetical protein